jgi:hypothetical protein
MVLVPSRKNLYARQLADAQKKGVEERLKLAEWTIKHGLVQEFYNAIDLVLESDPNNDKAREITALRQRLAADMPDYSVQQKYLEEDLPTGFKFKKSAHYILAYDTPENKAQERLDLLERVYDTFFMFFAMKGRILERPSEPLMVVLFNEHKAYEDYSVRLNPDLRSALGYWSPERNVAVFFAQATSPRFTRLRELWEKIEKDRKEAERQRDRNRGDLVRLADTVKLLMLIRAENEDVEVVTHEATHQIAGNSGLFPRRIRIPKFAQEGMAAYFEAPEGATWAGVGAINKERIEWYRVLAEHDRVHSDIDYIISDQIYTRSGRIGSNIMHAYGQAWALTHFLIDKHFNELDQFWKNLARLPADMIVSEDDLKMCFDAAFGTDRRKLDLDWRRHMDGMKTDYDRLKEQYGEKLSVELEHRPTDDSERAEFAFRNMFLRRGTYLHRP